MEQVKTLLNKLELKYDIYLHYKTEDVEHVSFTVYSRAGHLLDGRHKAAKKLIELLKLKFRTAHTHIYKGIIYMDFKK